MRLRGVSIGSLVKSFLVLGLTVTTITSSVGGRLFKHGLAVLLMADVLAITIAVCTTTTVFFIQGRPTFLLRGLPVVLSLSP